jgi:hypothetical protein
MRQLFNKENQGRVELPLGMRRISCENIFWLKNETIVSGSEIIYRSLLRAFPS